MKQKIDDILNRLTLEEKIALLGGQGSSTTPIPEKDIPPFATCDGPCGCHAHHVAYPATVGLAASFDRDLAYRYGEALGQDAASEGICFQLGPAVNIYRSPLCGRNFEYMGEDPYLAGETAAAYIKGMQAQGVSATIKHFSLNFQEYNRYFTSSDVDERTLREIYLPAFEKAVKEARVGAVMSAYNLLNGEHCSQNRRLLTEILKEEWGFDGIVMSDWVSTHDGVAAAKNGLDLEMPDAACMNAETLLPAIEREELSEDLIDDKLRRLFGLAFRFGWFDRDPDKAAEAGFDAGAPMLVHDSPELTGDGQVSEVALEVARNACVLLRNEADILPLERSAGKRIAVIGPSAHPAITGGGGSSCIKVQRAVSTFDGIRALAGDVRVDFAKGVDPWRQDIAFNNARYTTPDGRDGLLGEYFNNLDLEGEPTITRVDEVMNLLWMTAAPAEGIRKREFSIRWTGRLRPERDGAHVFYFSGGDGEYRVCVGENELWNTWGKGHTGARRKHLEIKAGEDYDVLIEYRPVWQYNWVQFGWEHEDEIWPDKERALELARNADAVIFCGGHARCTEGENSDRTFNMPDVTEELLLQVLDCNPNVITVLTGGGNIDMRNWGDRVRAILHSWYPGQEGGTAVAEILFGDVNPSARLPMTFEHCLEDRSSFDCYHDGGTQRVRLTDRIFTGYRHTDRDGIVPRYPFGFGLSYTSFQLSNLRLSSHEISSNETLIVTATVTNTGKRKGKETVQVYVSDQEASLPRPPKELKGFTKAELEAGESKDVEVVLDSEAWRFYDDRKGKWTIEGGKFDILVGTSAAEIALREAISLVPASA